MSDWKSTTPYWSFKRPASRRDGTRPKSHRQLRLDPPHQHGLVSSQEDLMKEEDDVDIAAFWARTRAGIDRYALPVAWGAVALGISLAAWFVFAPVAPEVPRPEPGYPVRLLDPLWPGATTRDGRRASYVDRAPDNGRPEPPLHTHDRKGAPR